MSYFNKKREVKDTVDNRTVAVAAYDVGAEIIARALNHYFGNTFTRNESVEMMNANTGYAFKKIADFVKKHEYDAEQIIIYLIEVSEEMAAQALVVSLRDECKFDKPKTS